MHICLPDYLGLSTLHWLNFSRIIYSGRKTGYPTFQAREPCGGLTISINIFSGADSTSHQKAEVSA